MVNMSKKQVQALQHSLILRHLHLHSFRWNLRVWPSLETCTSSVCFLLFPLRCARRIIRHQRRRSFRCSKMSWLTNYAAFENSKLFVISLVMPCKASASSVRVPSPIAKGKKKHQTHVREEDRAFDSTKPVDRQRRRSPWQIRSSRSKSRIAMQTIPSPSSLDQLVNPITSCR